MKHRKETISAGLNAGGNIPENPLKIVDIPEGLDKYELFFYKLPETMNIFSHTFEFYVEGGKLYVRYNNNSGEPLKDLLTSRRHSEIKELLSRVYDYLKFQYSRTPEWLEWKKNGKKWEEILLLFISGHLSQFKDPLDVIIRSNGQIVLNTEL